MAARRLARVLVAASALAAPPAVLAQPGPLGPQFQVNEWTTGSQYGPVAARDGAGNFVVVWDSFGGAGTDASRSVQGRRYDAGGTVGHPVRSLPDGADQAAGHQRRCARAPA